MNKLASQGVSLTKQAYALTGQYDLGGGATVNGGIQKNYKFLSGGDAATTADFGISMAF